ncbi:unnamed protein product [Eruca vesicaria subsp. sativa]|uniref:Uncharacterized protein n=1 Tax=Eruca vesicaria subsp. sativa TaxID=29727 RepID=A0ABC8K5B8_ERUVS|nr:unnamed protein product [Eruca vesicaria subsp. sativa]
MYGRDPWGGPLEINAADSITEDDRSHSNLQELDHSTLPRPLDATQQSWLLGPPMRKKKKYVDLGCILVSHKIFLWTLGTLLVTTFLAGSITMIVRHVLPHHKHEKPQLDNYTIKKYIQLLRNSANLEKLRQAKEAISAVFPLSPSLWLE